MEEIGDSEYDVAVRHAGEEASADEIGPALGICFGAGKAERRFTGKSDLESFATLHTTILGKAHGVGIATIDHFSDDGVVIIRGVARIIGGKCSPVIGEYALESGFVDMLAGCKFSHS